MRTYLTKTMAWNIRYKMHGYRKVRSNRCPLGEW